MRVFITGSYDIQRLKLYIHFCIKKINTCYEGDKIIIIDESEIDDNAIKGEQIIENETYYIDLLTNRVGLYELLRMKRGKIVYINLLGCKKVVKDRFVEYLQIYKNYIEQYVQNLIVIDDVKNINYIAMQIEKSFFVHSLNWKQKDFSHYLKRQKRELFRFRYIYNCKLAFSLFLLVGKLKRKLGFIR